MLGISKFSEMTSKIEKHDNSSQFLTRNEKGEYDEKYNRMIIQSYIPTHKGKKRRKLPGDSINPPKAKRKIWTRSQGARPVSDTEDAVISERMNEWQGNAAEKIKSSSYSTVLSGVKAGLAIWGDDITTEAVDGALASDAYSVAIGLGVVIQGATPHADLILSQVELSLAALSRGHALPVINGVVAARSVEQAVERCGSKAGNRGRTAAEAAIEMANLYQTLQGRSNDNAT